MPKISIPLAASTWDEAEFAALLEVTSSNKFTMGERVKIFESQFAEYFGSRHAVMVNSGSSANLLAVGALAVLGRGKFRSGANVIVPAVSWATTYYPITQYGLELRFVDINPDTLCIDTAAVASAIDEKTAAVFAVNLLGQPADLPNLKILCDQKEILLLEDNCESMGAQIQNKMCGTWGIAGTFSTFFSHHMSTMEGGLVVTDDNELADAMRAMRAHGWTRDLGEENTLFQKSGSKWNDLFTFLLPGYNLRPIEFQGALGSTQLDKFPKLLEARLGNAKVFVEAFGNIEGLRIQSGEGASSWFGFSIVLTGSLKGKREKFVNFLENLGVETRPIVSGNFTKQPVLAHLPHSIHGSLPVSDELNDDGLFIGNHHFDITTQLWELADLVKDWIVKGGDK